MKSLSFGLSLCILASAAPTAAQFGRPKQPTTRAEVEAGARKQFASMDSSKDGFLQASEIEAAYAKMTSMMKFFMGKEQSTKIIARLDAGPGGGARMVARLDQNKDGKLSFAEYLVQPLQRFEWTDTNKDGKISKAEQDAANAAFMK